MIFFSSYRMTAWQDGKIVINNGITIKTKGIADSNMNINIIINYGMIKKQLASEQGSLRRWLIIYTNLI